LYVCECRAEVRKEEWLRKGHGELQEVQERDFFSEAKGEERVLCLFYRESWPCQVMEKHLRDLARCHIETKFLKIQAEKAPFLAGMCPIQCLILDECMDNINQSLFDVERLKIWMLPTLAMVKNGSTTDYVVGLDELGGHEDFDPSLLEGRLVGAGILFEGPCAKPKCKVQVNNSITKGGFRKSESDEDSDFD